MRAQDLLGEQLDPGQQRLQLPLQIQMLNIALQQLSHEQEVLRCQGMGDRFMQPPLLLIPGCRLPVQARHLLRLTGL